MDYIEQLCRDLQISSQAEESTNPSSSESIFSLRFSDKITVKITSLFPGISFYSTLGPCPKTNKESLFILLMKANLFGQGTKGASLGLNREGNLLTVSLAFPYDMDYKTFKEHLEDFVNVAYYWQEEIEKHALQTKEQNRG